MVYIVLIMWEEGDSGCLRRWLGSVARRVNREGAGNVNNGSEMRSYVKVKID